MAARNDFDALNERFSNVSISNDDAAGEPSNPSQSRTPVDEYFYQHASRPGSRFPYNGDARLNIRKTFNTLARAERWNERKRMEEKERFFEAIDAEFTTRFGDGTSLQTWQRLVAMFDPEGPLPPSITRCKKELSKYYINIYDFLNYCRRMGIDEQAGVQGDLRSIDKGSLQILRAYSKRNRLLYPLDFARGTVLKAFLVHMFG
ncbi:uncharacterized protein DFL_002731 [Arthrobotrys flagrans]|uniref:Uncharacterized protein n=1 Tax=Arthrobotrys flagrans TaxID=97331 RepID=A0A437ABA4_ARTFL|nr:hypothetical protein DFL_002731 [Arthrobotrys flagrans]